MCAMWLKTCDRMCEWMYKSLCNVTDSHHCRGLDAAPVEVLDIQPLQRMASHDIRHGSPDGKSTLGRVRGALLGALLNMDEAVAEENQTRATDIGQWSAYPLEGEVLLMPYSRALHRASKRRESGQF